MTPMIIILLSIIPVWPAAVVNNYFFAIGSILVDDDGNCNEDSGGSKGHVVIWVYDNIISTLRRNKSERVSSIVVKKRKKEIE